MKKIAIAGIVSVITTMNANAGWLSDLFAPKQTEPATLAEACNIDEITAVCPEIVLGQKTLVECLTDNVKTVSKKCTDYVKKLATENNPEIDAWTATLKEKANSIQESSDDKLDDAKEAASAQVTDIKQQVKDKVDNAKVEIAEKLLESATANK